MNPTNPTNSGKGFLKGIRLSHFLDTIAEWHALVNGLCEVLCPWPPFRKLMSQDRAREIADEYHYYTLGRALGILAWLCIGCGLAAIFS